MVVIRLVTDKKTDPWHLTEFPKSPFGKAQDSALLSSQMDGPTARSGDL
jgi:hypothetical protein